MNRYAQGYAYCNPRPAPRRWPLNRRGTAALVAALCLATAALLILWR